MSVRRLAQRRGRKGEVTRSIPATFRSLRYRNARLFFAGLAVSNVGTWLQLTAMSLLVFRLTGEATTIGITIALQFLPMLLLGAWAGSLADSVDRRKMAILTQSGMAVQALVLGVIDLAGWANVGWVYALALVLGVVNALDNPARRGLVTELVRPAEITNATSLNTAVMTGSRIFGPALAAVLVDTVGTAWCFIINGVTFAALIGSLVAIRPEEMFAMPRRAAGGQPIRDALRFLGGRRDMLLIHVVLVIVSTFAFNHNVALPALAEAEWGGDSGFGWVLAVMSVGSLVGSLLTARLEVVTIAWFIGNITVFGAAGLVMSFVPNLAWAFVLAIPVGLGGAGFITAANALTQQAAPSDMRSRLLALQAVAFLGSTPIGGPITGVVADTFGASWSFAYGSIAALLCAAGAAAATARHPLHASDPAAGVEQRTA